VHRPEDAPIILVRGVGDIGSAVAHRLFREGYGVVIHDDPKPTMTRRGMAFADAAFDGHAVLDGVRAVRADDLERVKQVLARRDMKLPISDESKRKILWDNCARYYGVKS